MANLPTQGATNWGATLNEFLLVGQNEDGTTRNHIDVINVRDYGATGDPNQPPAEVTAAVQSASASGAHLYFPAGTYRFESWAFAQSRQRITFAQDALLQPATVQSSLQFTGDYQVVEQLTIAVPSDLRNLDAGQPTWPNHMVRGTGHYQVIDQLSLHVPSEVRNVAPHLPNWQQGIIYFSGHNKVIRNLNIDALGFVARLVTIERGDDCRLENLQILGVNTTVGVYIGHVVKCIFAGGAIKGNNSYRKTPGSIGLQLGGEPVPDNATGGYTGMWGFKAFGLTIHHWETGVEFAGPTFDDPSFFGCNIENNILGGINIKPRLGPNDQWGGAVKSLGLFGCHFEGQYQAIIVGSNSTLYGATISGCAFGLNVGAETDKLYGGPDNAPPQRIVNAQGVLRSVVITGCHAVGKHLRANAYIWELQHSTLNCLDLFNLWVDMPNGNFATGLDPERVIRLSTKVEHGNGRTLDLDGWFCHTGQALGFYGNSPVSQPTGYVQLAVDAAPAVIVHQLNKLTNDLATLGLLQQSA